MFAEQPPSGIKGRPRTLAGSPPAARSEDPCHAYSFGRPDRQPAAAVPRMRSPPKSQAPAQRPVAPGGSKVGPNTVSNAARRAASACAIVAARPRSARLVTPKCGSRIPQGAMPEKCGQIGIDVQRHAVKRRPTPDANADRGNLVFSHFCPATKEVYRDARPTRRPAAPCSVSAAMSNAFSDSMSQLSSVATYARAARRPAAVEVEHDVGDPLPWPVIGELAAAADTMNRKARVNEVTFLGARAGRVERGMLDKPNPLGRSPVRDRVRSRLHFGESIDVWGQPRRDEPFDWRRAIGRKHGGAQRKARIGHAALYQMARNRASGASPRTDPGAVLRRGGGARRGARISGRDSRSRSLARPRPP